MEHGHGVGINGRDPFCPNRTRRRGPSVAVAHSGSPGFTYTSTSTFARSGDEQIFMQMQAPALTEIDFFFFFGGPDRISPCPPARPSLSEFDPC